MKTRFLMGVMLSLLLLSCSTSKENNLAYFKNLGTSTQGELPEGMAYDIRIQPDDELIISVTQRSSRGVGQIQRSHHQLLASLGNRSDLDAAAADLRCRC